MTRKEYMEQLSRALENVEPEVARDIMEDYEAHFERARESGHSDEEVIEELGSIEEFSEELEAFISGKHTQKKRENPEKGNAQESNVKEENTEEGNAGEENTEASGEGKKEAQEQTHKGGEEENPQKEQNPQEEQERREREEKEEELRRAREQSEEEMRRAREEMNRAYEEMLRAKEQLERAAKEQERQGFAWGRDPYPGWENAQEEMHRQRDAAKEEMRRQRDAAKEEMHRQRDAAKEDMRRQRDAAQREREQGNAGWDNIADSVYNSTKNIAGDVLRQVSKAMDKAFSGIGSWMSGFEKSGEDAADYRRRQENARNDADALRGRNAGDSAGGDAGRSRGKDAGINVEIGIGRGREKNVSFDYSYDKDYSCEPEDGGEQYVPESGGTVAKEEGIRHIVVDSKSAEVRIRQSENDIFSYRYINEGSAGSKIVYRCEKRVSQDTLTLSIVKDEQTRRKNHYTILGGVFDENTDLELELYLPEWIEALEVNGKSGDIRMDGVTIHTLMLKSMSGDIELEHVNADKCMAETMSGDAVVKNGSFTYVLAASKSGDASGQGVHSDKAAFKSMSGDAYAENCAFNEAAVSSMSGDASAKNIAGGILSVSSLSGDAEAQNLYLKDVKVSAVSGSVNMSGVEADNIISTTVSGDLEGSGLSAGALKASATSGDMSLRGHAEEMNLANGSGDIIVVENGDTKAHVDTRSGEIHYHLKNEGAGFAAKVTTHGETSFRYGSLRMEDAQNGIHRYGAEGSSLEIVSVSGDISITD